MEDKTKNKGIETYADDLASVLENNEEGLIKKLIHEQEEIDLKAKKDSPESRQNKKFLIIGIALIFITFSVVYILLSKKEKSEVVEIKSQYKPIIFIEKTEFKDITDLEKEDIGKLIAREADSIEMKSNTIEGLYLTENKQIIGLRRMLVRLGSGFFPEETYVNDNFLMGTLYGDKNDFFLILQVSAFVDVFDPIRSWEKTMFKDLHTALGINLSVENNYLLTKPFEDGLFENKNSRILYDNEGNMLFMYIFAKDNFIVFTESEDSARELLLRLSGVKIEK